MSRKYEIICKEIFRKYKNFYVSVLDSLKKCVPLSLGKDKQPGHAGTGRDRSAGRGDPATSGGLRGESLVPDFPLNECE